MPSGSSASPPGGGHDTSILFFFFLPLAFFSLSLHCLLLRYNVVYLCVVVYIACISQEEESARTLLCVLHIKPFLLPVHIQHTQCPLSTRRHPAHSVSACYPSTCSTLSVRADSSSYRDPSSVVTKLRYRQLYTLYQVDSSSTMQCHCAGL